MVGVLQAAGTYLESAASYYDIVAPKQPTQSNVLSIRRQIFSGAVPRGNYGTVGDKKLYYPTFSDYMSSDSSTKYIIYENNNYKAGTNYKSRYSEQVYELSYRNGSLLEKNNLLPGFAATIRDESGTIIESGSIYDLYPGNTNLLNGDNVSIRFKVMAIRDGTNWKSPYLSLGDGFSVTIMTGTETITYTVDSNLKLKSDKISSYWNPLDLVNTNENLAYGFTFTSKQEIPVGNKVNVVIDAKYANSDARESRSFTFQVEGVPFLTRLVSENAAPGDDNKLQSVSNKNQLYGWSAAGGSDINGDGFPDLVVTDPYYLYGDKTVASGRAYVYFGGPDKVLDKTKELPAPDIIIDNPSQNSTSPTSREFAYKVKLGDINGDGYADIILGQPSYSNDEAHLNKGRLLIYYGGAQLKDGNLMMNVYSKSDINQGILTMVTPSIILQNNYSKTTNGNPAIDPLFGAVFDVGDLNGDGCADIAAKVGNNDDQKMNQVCLISGKSLSTGTNPKLSRDCREIELEKYYIIGDNPLPAYALSDVAIVSDFNRDGYNDLAISYPENSDTTVSYPRVLVFFSKPAKVDDGPIRGYSSAAPDVILEDRSNSRGYFGISVAGAGDINGDRYGDIIVGRMTNDDTPGKALIFLGRGGLTKGQKISYDGNEPSNSYPGIIAINEPREIWNSRNLSAQVTQFGLKVAGVGDLDNDGYDDMMVGAPFSGDSQVGAVYFIMGNGSLPPDSLIGEDNLKTYVLTGHETYAHYGKEIVPIGDFAQNGHNAVLITAPGYHGNASFLGYHSSDSFRNPVSVHNLDIFSSAYSVDNSRPQALFRQMNPWPDTVAWDNLADPLKVVIFDKGQSGLEFNTLSIDFVEHDDNTRTIPGGSVLQSKMELMNSSDKSVLGSLFKLNSFWAAEGNPSEGMENYSDLNAYYASKFNERIEDKDKYADKTLNIYEKNPRFIGMDFTQTGSTILQAGNDYVLRLRFSDRGDGTIFSGSDANRQTTLTLNIVAKEELLTTFVNTTPSDNSPIPPGSYTKILDLNGDGFPEFIRGDAYDGEGKIYLYWGTGQQTFDGKNSTIISTGVSLTGASNISARIKHSSDGLKNTLFILAETDLFYLMGSKDLRNTTNIVLNSNNDDNCLRGFLSDTSGSGQFLGGGKLWVLKSNKPDVGDRVVVSDRDNKYFKFVMGDSAVNDMSDVIVPPATAKITAISAGNVLRGKTHQQLILGSPETEEVFIYDSDKVTMYSSGSEVAYSEAPDITLTNTKLPGARFGSALAAGYFDSELGQDGNPLNNDSSTGRLQNLAIGAPGAKINGNDTAGTGLVIVFKGDDDLPTGKIDIFDDLVDPNKYYLLYGEQAGSKFGSSLVSVKYYGSPAHLSRWDGDTKDIFWDDADDLVISAPGFKIDGISRGKIYIHRGEDNNFPLKATSGYVNRNVTGLGESLANAGDVFGYQSDMIAVAAGNNIFLIQSGRIMDTTPPLLETFDPADRSYEVPTTQSISFTVSDVSGINNSRLDIIRVFSDRAPEVIVAAGVVQDPGRYVLSSTPSNNLAKRVTYTLKLDDKVSWKEGELVRLNIKVGDGRMRYVNEGGRSVYAASPLYTSFDLGFITKFPENTDITEKEIIGKNTNSYFGSAVAYAGDVNKDGFADFIVGEYGAGEYGWMSGKAYLFLGSNDLTKMAEPAAEFSLNLGSTSSGSLVNLSSNKFGWRVAAAGDMNGDGYDDVAIVAQNASIDGGEAFILFGNPDPRMLDPTRTNKSMLWDDRSRIRSSSVEAVAWDNNYINFRAMSIKAAQLGDGLGTGIYGGGDLNGDGYDDLVIGAPYYDDGTATDTGRVYVIFGKADLQDIYARNSYKYSSVKDVYTGPLKLEATAAGVKIEEYDLTSGAPYDAKYFDQRPVGMIPNTNRGTYDLFGYTVLTNLNLNGDAAQVIKYNGMVETTINIPLSEILITALGYNDSKGKVYIYTGKGVGQYGVNKTPVSLEGEHEGDKFGFSLASVGDISADNNLGTNPSSGQAWTAGNEPLVGQDFLVGAPGSKGSPKDLTAQPDVGAVYLYLTKPKHVDDFDISSEPALTIYGQHSGDQFGYAVSNVGNINNDNYGNNDFAIGAPFFDNGQTANTGRVYIYGTNLSNANEFLGNAHAKYEVILSEYPEQIATGKRAYEFFGAAISYLGDIDSDYSPEYIVGAPGYFSGSPADNNGFGASIIGNIGRVYLYTNPDKTPPLVYEPMANIYIKPYPGDKLAELATPQKRNKDVTINNSDGSESVTRQVEEYLVYNRPITFRVYDERAVKLDSVLAEVEVEYYDFLLDKSKTETKKYTFTPSLTGVRYSTYVNRKNVDYFLNLANSYYHNATYNVRIYASDVYPNNMEYYYGHPSANLHDGYWWYYDKWGSGTKTIGGQLYATSLPEEYIVTLSLS
ncbi:putative integrin alpha [Candidatus Termititenax persephonae]|uniref:Integrin alpha n=1 Tax=Candidatus Termititenax persephonae TaxID=2218525 RepID=A0A388TIR8_9BACT|nr:putative integrin alpha [Candidatus Termititenax persephonae]